MKLRDLLELMRVSNLPTVWSNVSAGYVIGLSLFYANLYETTVFEVDLLESARHMQKWLLLHPLIMIVGVSLIYCGGMVLNDYWDRAVDAQERPSRPIPSGRVKPSTACSLSVWLLSSGFLLSGGWLIAVGLTGTDGLELLQILTPHLSVLVLLVLCVVLYNYIHQAKTASVVLMGLCRVFAFLVPAMFYAGDRLDEEPLWVVFIIGPAVSLFAYTLLISVVARREVDPKRGGFGGPKTIMNLIAAMPLLDAVWLVAMGLWPASLVCVACAGLTKLGHRRIAGS